MIKLGLLFMCADRLPHWPLWRDWLAADPRACVAGIHAHKREWNGPSELTMRLVQTVPSKWERTVPVIRQLALTNTAPDCTHFLYVSESCVPVHASATPLCDWLEAHAPESSVFDVQQRKHMTWAGRKVDWSALHPDFSLKGYKRWHEQWHVLHARHVEAYAVDAYAEAFQDCFADNEHYGYHAIYTFDGGPHNIVSHPITYTDWSLGGPHPRTVKHVMPDWMRRAAIKKGCFVARKVVVPPEKPLASKPRRR